MQFSPYFSFISGTDPLTRAFESSYDPGLATLSVLIAIFASFVALELSGRIRQTHGTGARALWHGLGALSLGAGIWAMHFIGMLAFRLECGVYYDPFVTFFSMLPGVFAAAVALHIISRPRITPSHLLVGGVVMGGGIGVMHYTGMAAMRLNGILRYDPKLFVLSIVVAVVLAVVALAIRFALARRERLGGRYAWAIAAATVMGCAISGMHYTAMEAAWFLPAEDGEEVISANPALLAWGVSGVTLLIIVVALASAVGSRKLRASESRYNSIVRAMRQGLVRLGAEGEVVEANPAFLAMVGRSEGEVIGRPLVDFLAGGTARTRLLGRLHGEQSREFDAIVVAAGGELLPVQLHLDVHEEGEGEEPLRFATFTRRERTQSILCALHEAVCGLDREGLLEVANPAAELLFEEKEAALLGRPVLERFREAGGRPADPAGLLAEARRHQTACMELQLTRRAGGSVPVSFLLNPLDLDDAEAGYVLVFSDISETRRAELRRRDHERQLAFLNQQLELLLEHSRDIVYLYDRDAFYTYISPAAERITGHDWETWSTHREALLTEHPVNESIPELTRQALSGEAPPPYLMEVRHRDGRPVMLEVHEQPFREHDQIAGVIGVARDVTERTRLEREAREARDEAERAAQAKGDFLATMSHEIRTPMNVVIGMSDLLLETRVDDDQRGYIGKLQQAGNTLLELINNILDLSKIEAGQWASAEEPFSPERLLHDTCAVMEVAAHGKGIALTLESDEAVAPCLLGDAVHIRQVLINLIGNAIKFTEKGGVTVHLAPGENGEGIRCTVHDTGTGIPPDQLDQVFDKFTQADSSATRRFGGTGLGLAISRWLVELMGGRIAVESVHGEGSTFHFTLPLARVADENCAPPERPALSEGEGRPLRILLAEDSPDNRLLIAAYLKKSPHTLVTAENGEQAVGLALEEPFDLVLMDLQMPVMDGYTATRAIRAWERDTGREPMPIVALTAHALTGDEQKSLEAGCDAHLTKPIKKAALLRFLDDIANRTT